MRQNVEIVTDELQNVERRKIIVVISVSDPWGLRRSTMLNNHNIILLFNDFYNRLLFMRKSYTGNYEVILFFYPDNVKK